MVTIEIPEYRLKVLKSGLLHADSDGPTVWLVISTSNRFQIGKGHGHVENAAVVFSHDDYMKILKKFRELTSPE
jgi:hypothetical protein